jgi:hypothetical protein
MAADAAVLIDDEPVAHSEPLVSEKSGTTDGNLFSDTRKKYNGSTDGT